MLLAVDLLVKEALVNVLESSTCTSRIVKNIIDALVVASRVASRGRSLVGVADPIQRQKMIHCGAVWCVKVRHHGEHGAKAKHAKW